MIELWAPSNIDEAFMIILWALVAIGIVSIVAAFVAIAKGDR